MSRPNFNDLSELHNCANNLLHSPMIQQALAHQQQQTSEVQELSETILRMLDLCDSTKDILLLVKQHLHDLQYIFYRTNVRFESMEFHGKMKRYNTIDSRKKLKKEVTNCLRELKVLIKNKYFSSELSLIDDNLIVVVHVLREVRMTTISIVESLLSLISLPATVQYKKSNKGGSFARFMYCQRLVERCDTMTLQSANRTFEAGESAMEDLEVELECICRRLIKTRVLLLNIITTS